MNNSVRNSDADLRARVPDRNSHLQLRAHDIDRGALVQGSDLVAGRRAPDPWSPFGTTSKQCMVTTSKPGTVRSFWWAPGVLFAALTAFYLFFIVDGTWHQGWDSATYLLTARTLQPDGDIRCSTSRLFSGHPDSAVLPVLVDWRKRAASFLSAQHIDGLARIGGACSDLCRVPSRYWRAAGRRRDPALCHQSAIHLSIQSRPV